MHTIYKKKDRIDLLGDDDEKEMIVIVPDLTKVQNRLDLLVNDNNNGMILNVPAIQKEKIDLICLLMLMIKKLL